MMILIIMKIADTTVMTSVIDMDSSEADKNVIWWWITFFKANAIYSS